MPRPVSGTLYLPGLDGLRALSVLAVVGYHLDFEVLGGGFLGVGMFFTLSGFLITRLLLHEWHDSKRIDLRAFWYRRFRRLLPAVIVLVVVVVCATALSEPAAVGDRVRDAVAALLYVSNWATISSGTSYFDRFAGLGPLDHLWSLAIEEQFYVVWPIALGGLLRLFRGHLGRVLLVTLSATTLSFVLLHVLATTGLDNTRAYEGTDTRAGGILLGAAVSLWIAWRGRRQSGPHGRIARLAAEVSGVLAVAAIAVMCVATDQYSRWTYDGGLLLLSSATAIAVVRVCDPHSVLSRVVGVAPLRWVGERSYGIYLWHVPLIAMLPTDLVERPLLRSAVVIGGTLTLAELSWVIVEDPIRRHGVVGAMRSRFGVSDTTGRTSSSSMPAGFAWSAMGVFATAVLVAAAMSGTGPATTAEPAGGLGGFAAPAPGPEEVAPSPVVRPSAAPASGTTRPSQDLVPPFEVAGVAVTADPTPRSTQGGDPGSPGTDSVAALSTGSTGSTVVGPVASEAELAATGCGSVAHVGDSTSLGLVSASFLPDPADRIDAQYRLVGAERVVTDILGARSIVEQYKGQPNAETGAQRLREAGHDGCWVFALGTNEAANQAAGSRVRSAERIDSMMAVADGAPVLWLTVRTLRRNGPYADREMVKFNASLRDACRRYPNLRLYDWADEVDPDWYQGDGIHFTSWGNAQRGRLTAIALAIAFPETPVPGVSVTRVPSVSVPGSSDGTLPCVVHTPLSVRQPLPTITTTSTTTTSATSVPTTTAPSTSPPTSTTAVLVADPRSPSAAGEGPDGSGAAAIGGAAVAYGPPSAGPPPP